MWFRLLLIVGTMLVHTPLFLLLFFATPSDAAAAVAAATVFALAIDVLYFSYLRHPADPDEADDEDENVQHAA